MGTSLTVADILKSGIQREIEAQRLYAELGRRVEGAAAKYAFSTLSEQEQRHQRILEQYLSGGLQGGVLDPKQTVDYRIAEYLDEPALTPDMKLPDIFLVAANREKTSCDFYTRLADMHPDGETKRLLGKLASEELGHKQKVESMYADVAFPQTDGG